jgi:hypothetical protein
MKVISFDIGIVNMAYCVFSIKDEPPSLEVEHWGIINLSKTEEATTAESHSRENTLGCNCLLKSKKQCTKKAEFKKGSAFFCKRHSQEQTEWQHPDSRLISSIKKMKLEEVVETATKYGLSKETKPIMIKNIIEVIQSRTLEECNIAPPAPKKASLLEMIQNLKAKLDAIEGIEQITHVLLENQISSFAAAAVTTMQGVVAMYFLMKCSNATIENISAVYKLKGLLPKNEKTSYETNKKTSVECCLKMTEVNPFLHGWREMLQTHRKKMDDLCDAFLQGIGYLKQHNKIVYDDDFKIICV